MYEVIEVGPGGMVDGNESKWLSRRVIAFFTQAKYRKSIDGVELKIVKQSDILTYSVSKRKYRRKIDYG